MQQEITQTHRLDADGKPAGGFTEGKGIAIRWQDGPLGRPDSFGNRDIPNGAFVEGVILAALDRIKFYESTEFACIENITAISQLEAALASLQERTRNREERKVEGTHKV